MPTIQEINGLSAAAAKEFFLSCCGSVRWAENMAACRPYWNIQVVFNAADVIWSCLAVEDWRQAIARRSVVEEEELPPALAEDLDLFRTKFGYSFVIAPPLPPHDRLHDEVRRRLEYPAKAEFDLSAAEEYAIMRGEIRKRITE